MEQATKNSPRAIFAFDPKGGFNNASHASVLTTLQSTNCGERAYKYMRDLLTDRRAEMKVEEQVSSPIVLARRGIPQGFVLSPLIFNMELHGLPKALGTVEGLEHALYADDITPWTTKARCSGWIQDTLQAYADVVDK